MHFFTIFAIVTGEDDNGIFTQSSCLQAIHQAPDQDIDVFHQALKTPALITPRSAVNWSRGYPPACHIVHQVHRIVSEKWLVLVPLDEINQEAGVKIWPKIFGACLHQLAITNHTRVPVASGHGLRIREIVFTFKLPSKGRAFRNILQSQRADALLVKANILRIDGAAQCHWITHNRRPVTMLSQYPWECQVLTHPVPACLLRTIEA